MNEQTPGQDEHIPISETTVYERMCHYLYDYRFGRITFLELLEKWKEVLNLPPGGTHIQLPHSTELHE
jgi:hypothetical protein